jgi:hypothetical protein
MPHNPLIFPPVANWPILTPPDCPTCRTCTDVTWTGHATDMDDGSPVLLWECRACTADWCIPTQYWPVLDGADCPYCASPNTCWATVAPEHPGDLWTCDYGHEFVLTPEGLIITPDGDL